MNRLEGKVAVITGCSHGMGLRAAQLFADEGAKVLATSWNMENLEKNLAGYSENIVLFQLDVREEDQWASAAAKAEELWGKIDILVNNAGISAREPLYQYDPAAFKNIMDLNVTAVFNGCRAVAPIMKAQGGGSIINTSSMVSLYGQPSGVGYPTSKFAVNGLTRSLARELGRDNIRVNAVAPGVTRTDMVANLPEEMVKRVCAPIPLQRMGEPQEVANAFLFLASDLASYVTGEILSVDGAAQT